MQPLSENTVNTPAFLGKLWKMVNDPSTDHLISWGPNGNSFVIQNQAQFWYELLPLYYKHNNMSSFVRQLNMYGFHKMSTVENGTMDADRDEIQFMHPFFVKDQPELLRNIKRKATVSKATNENSPRHDELTKVLTDVKQLRGRQASVDSQLNAMKQENALLWREVAILRQKHLKQQKIVNKLIQFLVTLVQPSRMTVGVKRGHQLMLNESPVKKAKANNNKTTNEGPTIHELDSELDLPTDLYEDEALEEASPAEIREAMINSPAASVGSQQNDVKSPLIKVQLLGEDTGDIVTESLWDNDKPEYVDIDNIENIDNMTPSDIILNEQEMTNENLINTLECEAISPNNEMSTNSNEKVFLNPATQDTLLSNLKNNYTIATINDNKKKQDTQTQLDNLQISPAPTSPNLGTLTNPDTAVATRDTHPCEVVKSTPGTSNNYSIDLNSHIESTQSELEQFKDILNGYNAYVDANALLGELNKIPQNYKDANLFTEDPPIYELNEQHIPAEKNENLIEPVGGPLLSGSQLTPYSPNFDFTELFDDSLDGNNVPAVEMASSTVNTPQIVKDEPIFPIANIKK